MVTIQKARSQDFERVYPLLAELNVPYITKENWQQLFINHWNVEEDYHGFMLLDQDNVVGFFGLIFSRRTIRGESYKFCNLTSWIVKQAYRKHSMSLLYAVLKLKDYTLTDLTATKVAYKIFKKFDFQDGETHVRIIPWFISLFHGVRKCLLTWDPHVIAGILKGENLKIFEDHKEFPCIHLVFHSPGGSCYCVLTKIKKKGLAFGHIHYLSDKEFFCRDGVAAVFAVCRRLNVIGLYIDEQRLKGEHVFPSVSLKLNQPKIFRSNDVGKEDIDSLYSECVILPL